MSIQEMIEVLEAAAAGELTLGAYLALAAAMERYAERSSEAVAAKLVIARRALIGYNWQAALEAVNAADGQEYWEDEAGLRAGEDGTAREAYLHNQTLLDYDYEERSGAAAYFD